MRNHVEWRGRDWPWETMPKSWHWIPAPAVENECHICLKSFKNWVAFKKYYRSCMLTCYKCEIKFKIREARPRHENTALILTSQLLYTCPFHAENVCICVLRASSTWLLSRAIISPVYWPAVENEWQMCSKSFKNLAELTSHCQSCILIYS